MPIEDTHAVVDCDVLAACGFSVKADLMGKLLARNSSCPVV
jgi:hypothetical protein